MVNTRPFTRDELKTLRRANLQNLFKLHGLKGANATNSVLIDTLVEYFASPSYLTAHPSFQPIQPGVTIAGTGTDKGNGLSKGPSTLPSLGRKAGAVSTGPIKPARGRVVSATLPRPRSAASTAGTVASGTSTASTTSGAAKSARRPQSGTIEAKRAPATLQVGAARAGLLQAQVEEPMIADSTTQGVTMMEHDLQSLSTSNGSQAPPVQQPDSPATHLPTPPLSTASTSRETVTLSQVEALLQANDAQWQARLAVLEKNLNEQMERLRLEMSEIRTRIGGSSADGALQQHARHRSLSGVSGRTWSPWENRSVSGPSGHSSQSQHTLPFSVLGKRRNPATEAADSSTRNEGSVTRLSEAEIEERAEAKRVRFNGSRPGETPTSEVPPAFAPKTPSPRVPTTAFGSDYFAHPTLNVPEPVGSGIAVPRTPSPSRHGAVPDNSQTPRLPADWQSGGADQPNPSGDVLDEEDMRTPDGASTIPQFSTTPEPPMFRPISPTMERSVSASSDRLTPGRVLGPTPSTGQTHSRGHSEERRLVEGGNGIPLSTVTDLERIEETDEQNSNSNSSRNLISPAGQLRFPAIKPTPRLSGLGMPTGLGVGSPSKARPTAAGPSGGHQRTPSLLAAPVLISRGSRSGSEVPTLRIPSRGLSPPPRPRSASAIHGATTPPRNVFPLNLPDGESDRSRVRSASADYMHVAMHGLEADDDLDFDEGAQAGGTLASAAGFTEADRLGRQAMSHRREAPTPGHRTLLGTERYNDKRFGDIPVGFGFSDGDAAGGGMGMGVSPGMAIWESPRPGRG
ncbi:hypothetical protein IAU60_002594 [Kwoniella sp. DSM 27419]